MDTKLDKEKRAQPKVSIDAHVSTFRIENLTNELDASSELNDQTPGSKSLVSAKRAAQNRAAQRAFRQRKEQHIKGLESKAKRLDIVAKNSLKLKAENEALWQIINRIKNGENIHNLTLPDKVELEDEGELPLESMSYFDESAQDDSYMSSYVQKEEATSPTFRSKAFNSVPDDKHFPSPVPPPAQGKANDFRRFSTDSNSTTSSCSFSPVNPKSFSRRLSTHGFPGPNVPIDYPSNNPPSSSITDMSTIPKTPHVISMNDHRFHSLQQSQEPNIAEYNTSVTNNQTSISHHDPMLNLQSTTYSPSTEQPSTYFNPEGANLSFLQYGWIFDSHAPQPDKGGSYSGVFGMSQQELDQNHEIMNNLYSLLEMDSQIKDQQDEIRKPSPVLSSKIVDVN
ncbi:hypothetical protein K7432_003725 [Basidiobolus ranarum]|uniref:BZIP domain-containing protein n=1 Tax=Basidiobolus ranarum TaxID=34480 RepID=A0ABR2WZB4_9FUNG